MANQNDDTPSEYEVDDENNPLNREEYDPSGEDESQLLSFGATMGLALGGFPVQKQLRKYNAFSALNNPQKAIENLLDIKNPWKYEETSASIDTVREQFLKKLRKGKLKRGDSTSASLFGIKRIKLTPEQVTRLRQVRKIAHTFHTYVADREMDIKIGNALNKYGLSDTPETFKAQVKAWMEKNPGRSFDDALHYNATTSYLTQKGVDPNDLTDKDKRVVQEGKYKGELKDRKKQVSAANKTVHDELLKSDEVKTVAGRAKESAVRASDPNQPLLTGQQWVDEQAYVTTGVRPGSTVPVAAQPQPTSTTTPAATSPSPAAPPPSSSPPAASAPATRLPSAPHVFKIGKWQFSLPSLSGVRNKVFGFLKDTGVVHFGRLAIRNAMAFTLKGMRRMGLRALAKFSLTAFKGGLSAALGISSLGTSFLAQIGLELAKKIPVIGGGVKRAEAAGFAVLKYSAIVIGLIIITPFALMYVFSSSPNNTFTSYVPDAPYQLGKEEGNIYAEWSKFEKNYLVYKPPQLPQQTLTWQQFEKERLIPQRTFLSLDANRHDEVEK